MLATYAKESARLELGQCPNHPHLVVAQLSPAPERQALIEQQ
jgi:hypothetical protein